MESIDFFTQSDEDQNKMRPVRSFPPYPVSEESMAFGSSLTVIDDLKIGCPFSFFDVSFGPLFTTRFRSKQKCIFTLIPRKQLLCQSILKRIQKTFCSIVYTGLPNLFDYLSGL